MIAGLVDCCGLERTAGRLLLLVQQEMRCRSDEQDSPALADRSLLSGDQWPLDRHDQRGGGVGFLLGVAACAHGHPHPKARPQQFAFEDRERPQPLRSATAKGRDVKLAIQ
jgi:hypothetical protein